MQITVTFLSAGIRAFMPTSQIIATLIDAGSLIAIGIAIPFVLPKAVQKLVESGKMEQAARFKKYGGWSGWFLIAFGIFKLVVAFMPRHGVSSLS